VLPLGQAEQDDAGDAETLDLLRLPGGLVDGEMEAPRQGRDLPPQPGPRSDEQRVDELRGNDPRLPDERAETLGSPEAAPPLDGEAHGTATRRRRRRRTGRRSACCRKPARSCGARSPRTPT